MPEETDESKEKKEKKEVVLNRVVLGAPTVQSIRQRLALLENTRQQVQAQISELLLIICAEHNLDVANYRLSDDQTYIEEVRR